MRSYLYHCYPVRYRRLGTAGRTKPILLSVEYYCMGLSKDFLNGIISLVISVAITVALAGDDDSYTLSDVTLSVAISAFLSGFFTSYFAE